MNWKGLRSFAADCDRLGVAVPEPVVRGLELAAVAKDSVTESDAVPLLTMSPDALLDRIEGAAFRKHTAPGEGAGILPGITEVLAQLWAEVVAATVPDLEQVVKDLQPQFDQQAGPLVDAAQRFGFTYATSSDDVINLDDAGAVDAWRAVRRGWFAIEPFVSLRLSMTNLFDVAPTAQDLRAARPLYQGRRGPVFVDTSVVFADGDNWSLNGESYIEPGNPRNLDWLRLAQGGLRLNSPSDVLGKLRDRRAAQLSSIVVPAATA